VREETVFLPSCSLVHPEIMLICKKKDGLTAAHLNASETALPLASEYKRNQSSLASAIDIVLSFEPS